ncbi:MAG TPA: hypothetical protein VFC77_02955, partial [Myxococcota bacterium]|nr:hypothetical protein [Myxococcota bacterium]
MRPIRASAVLLLAAGAACRATGSEAPRPPTQEEERAAAERHLRRMFPGIQGEVSPESIASELERQRAARDPESLVRGAASRAIEEGDFDRARDLLGELLAGEQVERAQELSREHDVAGALAALDRALEMAPRSAAILCARGETALALAESVGDKVLLESALANFLAVEGLDPGPDESGADLRVRAWLGAGRAARALGRSQSAREYAQNGLEAAPSSSDRLRFDVPLRRTLAQASFDVYLGAAQGGANAEIVRDRARDSQDALFGLLGRTPEDPWAWERLTEVSRTQGSAREAREIALRGLAIAPDDEGLLEDLALSARALGGPRAVVDSLEPFCRRHPDVAEAAWQLAEARFDLATTSARGGADPRPELAAAEAGFARARSIDPAFEERSREREARCRGALGLWLLERGEIEKARDAFLSMEDVRPGGLTLEVDPIAGRASEGLYRAAQAYAARADAGGSGSPGSPGSIESLEQAALILDLLHAADPDELRYAFGAGHANREVAVALELHAGGLVRAPIAERNRLLESAREKMERGFK